MELVVWSSNHAYGQKSGGFHERESLVHNLQDEETHSIDKPFILKAP